MSNNTEKAKLKALQQALKSNMNALKTGQSWGNVMMNYNAEMKAEAEAAAAAAKQRANQAAAAAKAARNRAAAEKAARNKAAAEKAAKQAAQAAKQAKVIEEHRAKFMTPSGLKKIAQECKWHCQGKSCFAHKAGVCPYIHKGGPGSSKATAITMKNTGSKKRNGSGRQTRKSRRN